MTARNESNHQLWDITTGRLLHEFPGYGDSGLSPDGCSLITNDERGLTIWSTTTYKQLYNLDSREAFRKWQVSPDGHYIMVFAADSSRDLFKERSLWDLRNGELARKFETNSAYIGSTPFTYTPDSHYLYLSSNMQADELDSFRIEVWNLATISLEKTIILDQSGVAENHSISIFDKRGKYWLVASASGHLYLRNAITGAKQVEYC